MLRLTSEAGTGAGEDQRIRPRRVRLGDEHRGLHRRQHALADEEVQIFYSSRLPVQVVLHSADEHSGSV